MKLPNLDFEKSLLPAGVRFVLGLDEAGRGPWAGPVAVTAFLLDLDNFDLDFFTKNKVRDSKTLSHLQLQKAHQQFVEGNYSFKTFFTTSRGIDKHGISKAVALSAAQAIAFYEGKFDFVLSDANIKIENHIPHKNIPKGDQNCFSIASASICAKVLRDAHMIVQDGLYPGYGFAKHKGYGTTLHSQSLQKLGICPIHRLSYKPINKIVHPEHYRRVK